MRKTIAILAVTMSLLMITGCSDAGPKTSRTEKVNQVQSMITGEATGTAAAVMSESRGITINGKASIAPLTKNDTKKYKA